MGLSLKDAAGIVREGGIIAYPTETFYGLAVDPKNEKAIQRIFEVKKRDAGKPIALILSGPDVLKSWINPVTPLLQKLARRFWPGALTILGLAKEEVSALLTAGQKTIGIRVSPHPMATDLARLCGGAITATSANLSGEDPMNDPAEVERKLGFLLDGIVDGGISKGTLPSTLVDVTQGLVKLVREGAIPFKEIEHVATEDSAV